jgi:hypothetical protein
MPESKRFLLRLDPRLFEVLRRWAEQDLRSINGQIEYLLTEQARRSGRLPRQTSPRPPRDISTDELTDPDELAAWSAARGRGAAEPSE